MIPIPIFFSIFILNDSPNEASELLSANGVIMKSYSSIGINMKRIPPPHTDLPIPNSEKSWYLKLDNKRTNNNRNILQYLFKISRNDVPGIGVGVGVFGVGVGVFGVGVGVGVFGVGVGLNRLLIFCD